MDDAEILRRAIDETRKDTDPLMAICLSCAVPLWIEKVRDWSPDMRMVHAHAAGKVIAYGSGAAAVATSGKERNKASSKKRKGKKGIDTKPREGPAEVFNALACGLAILAYCPGGVTWGGSHWEAKDTEKPSDNDLLHERVEGQRWEAKDVKLNDNDFLPERVDVKDG
jgi:hypothetical protein